MQLTVSGSMGLVKVKKFVIVEDWQRVEAHTDLMVNNTSGTFTSMGFGVDVRKFHI